MNMYNEIYHGNNNLKDYNFLVTGGAGFIGSNLVEYLLKHGAGKVRVLDNFSTGYSKNLEEFFKNENFELLRGDIRDLDTCKDAVQGMDYVLHQAALGSVPRSINDPLTSNNVNITGFLNILLASKEANIKRIVYAASSSTYGDSKELPKIEEVIGKPLSPYAVTKLVNELYADVFAKTYNMELIGLRYFNVFGPRQSPNGAYAAVIPKFVDQFIKNQSPVINGDGSVSRDFTYIDNVVQMNIKSLFTSNPNAVNQVYNVAYGERISLNDLIGYLKEFLSKFDKKINKIKVEYGSPRPGDIMHSLAAIDKAKNMLDYAPRYSVRDGLQQAVDWYIKDAKSNQNVLA